MTVEQVCFVSPEDIRGVRVECAKCHAAKIVPIAQCKGVAQAIVSDCQYCGQVTGFNFGTNEVEEFAIFNDVLSKLAKIMQGRGIKYSVQIECPDVK